MGEARLTAALAALRQRGEGALMPYLTAGDPDLETSLALCRAAIFGGADILELGLPFSDPLADGPVVQAAGQRALRSGTTIDGVLRLIAALRAESETPLVLLTYINPILRRGADRFCREMAEAGLDGLVIPDMPPDEAGAVRAAATAAGLAIIPLIAPTSADERLRLVASAAAGFVYCVTVTGVTGARQELSARLGQLTGRMRQHTNLPLLAGFGLSTPEHVRQACTVADGAIVGSALIQQIADLHAAGEPAAAIADFVETQVRALKAATKPQAHPD